MNDFPTEFKSEWEAFVKFATKVWQQFYKFYIDQATTHNLPVYFLRYEDLCLNQRVTLHEAFSFTLGVESIEGLFIEKRIDDVMSRKDAGFVYKPRSGRVNLNTNQKFFSEEMKNIVLKSCREYINFFGYTEVEGKENQFGFFKYDNVSDEEILKAGSFK